MLPDFLVAPPVLLLLLLLVAAPLACGDLWLAAAADWRLDCERLAFVWPPDAEDVDEEAASECLADDFMVRRDSV